ncbi:ABC transporter substrate-binding protein [Amycolatopsis sp. NPDC059027]|uniref:ABC transporter substrate-binding protein n=1 Tax=unclassified Amycolatopsis TaxID=2618356 RepID=UPI00366D10A7
MDRRSFLKAASLGAALPLLSACGRTVRDGKVRFEGWDYESQLVQQNVTRFTTLNPDVGVSYTPITSSQFIQKITAEFLGGGGPDVLYMYDDSLAGSVEAGYLQPLDGIAGVDEIYDAVYPSNAAAMTYQGKRYGLPYYTDMQSLVYNAEILGRAGISAPPKTLDELEEQALRIKRAGILEFPIGVAAQLSDTAGFWLWGLVYANEADLFDERLRPVMSASGSALTGVFAWLERVSRRSRVLDPACLQLLPVPMDNAVMAGRYAFVITSRYTLRNYNDPAKSKTAGKIRLAQLPSLDGRTRGTVSSTRMYCLGARTEVREKALRLLNYVGGFDAEGKPYTARFWFVQRGLGYAYRALADDPEITGVLRKFADPEVYAQLAHVAKARAVTAVPWYPEFEQSLQRATQRILVGATTAAAASASLDDTARSLAKRYE